MFIHEPVTLPTLTEDYSLGKRHYVTPEGLLVPSVTTILDTIKSEGLEEWKKLVGEQEAETLSRVAANRGSKLHEIVEKYLRDDYKPTLGYMPDVVSMFKEMKTALDKISVIYLLEGQVYSKNHRYAGRADIIGDYNQYTSIIDIKTNMSDLMYSGDKVEKYFLQLAAYAIAFGEQTGKIIERGVLIFTSPGYGVSVIIRPLHEYKGKWLKTVHKYHLNTSGGVS